MLLGFWYFLVSVETEGNGYAPWCVSLDELLYLAIISYNSRSIGQHDLGMLQFLKYNSANDPNMLATVRLQYLFHMNITSLYKANSIDNETIQDIYKYWALIFLSSKPEESYNKQPNWWLLMWRYSNEYKKLSQYVFRTTSLIPPSNKGLPSGKVKLDPYIFDYWKSIHIQLDECSFVCDLLI